MLDRHAIVTFLVTRDKLRAKAFYSETLGLRFIRDDGFAMVFEANGVMLRISEVKDFTPQPSTVLGWQSDDIARDVRALAARGVRFERYMPQQDELGIWNAPGGDQVAWFKDPDGNVLSLSHHVS